MARTQVLLAAVLFGTTGTAQALGPAIEPVVVGAGRIVVGGALLVALALVARRLRVGAGAGWVLLGGVFVAIYQVSFFAAVDKTGVAIGTVVALGSAPAFTGLVARAFTGEALGRRWAAATGLACAGVTLLVLGGGGSGESGVAPAGVALALLSGLGYAGYAVLGKRMLERGGTPEGVMAAVFGTGALLLLPVLLVAPSGDLLRGEGLALVLYLGAIPTALAYVLFARGLEQLGAAETSTLTLAEPLTATALGVIALGERPGLAAAAGAALVLAGLALLALRFGDPRPARRPRERVAEAPA